MRLVSWRVDATPLDFARLPWALPVRITGPAEFTLVAVWTIDAFGSYPSQARRMIAEMLPSLDAPVVVAGDFNAPTGRTLKQHLASADALGSLGLTSAFASARGVTAAEAHVRGSDGRPGPAVAEPTYFHYRKRERPHHIDHVFVPATWTATLSVAVGGYDDWVAKDLSDHVPLIVDVHPAATVEQQDHQEQT